VQRAAVHRVRDLAQRLQMQNPGSDAGVFCLKGVARMKWSKIRTANSVRHSGAMRSVEPGMTNASMQRSMIKRE
jgi:hypothetical protein